MSRWEKGVCGNKNGRPKKPEIHALREAIQKVQKERKSDLLEHFVRQAFEDNKVLVALAKKIIPDLSSISGELEMKQKILHCIGLEPIKVEDDAIES